MEMWWNKYREIWWNMVKYREIWWNMVKSTEKKSSLDHIYIDHLKLSHKILLGLYQASSTINQPASWPRTFASCPPFNWILESETNLLCSSSNKQITLRGFHSHGGTPNTGWSILGKSQSRNGWFKGYPHFRKPPFHHCRMLYGVPHPNLLSFKTSSPLAPPRRKPLAATLIEYAISTWLHPRISGKKGYDHIRLGPLRQLSCLISG